MFLLCRCPVDIVKDKFTQELTMAVRDKIYDLTGRYPHVILNDLHRRKLDANRDLYTAALGVPEMEAAWTEYHRYLYQAKAVVGRGLYCDIHRHSHPTQWVELGYLIPGPNLDSGDFNAGNSSIRNLAANSIDRITFEELLRGPRSFGSFLNQFDYPVVPSPENPGPDGEPFYSGGYNTRQHGSLTEGEIDAIQIESPWDFVEDNRRDDYADAIAQTMVRYLSEYYGMAYNSGDKMAQTTQLPQMIIFTLMSFTFMMNYNWNYYTYINVTLSMVHIKSTNLT